MSGRSGVGRPVRRGTGQGQGQVRGDGPRRRRRRADMTSELRRRRDQIRRRLSRHASTPHDTASEDVLPVLELKDVVKTGQLLCLCSRGILQPHCWKKRLCVLTKTRLLVYKTEGEPGREKAVGDIDLSVFNCCQEAGPNDTKKVSNSFVISRASLDRQALASDSTRHVFAASSPADMRDWLRKVRAVVRRAEHGRTADDASAAEDTRTAEDTRRQQRTGRRERRSSGSAAAPEAGGVRPSSCVDPLTVPLPPDLGSEPAARGQTGVRRPGQGRPRGRGPRPRPPTSAARLLLTTSSSQPCLAADQQQQQQQEDERLTSRYLLVGGGRSSAYEYSSSEESASSASSSRCSVVRRLNTTMPEMSGPRRSASPLAAAARTAASDTGREGAASLAAKPSVAEPPKPATEPGPVAPSPDLASEFGALSAGGASSTSGSSITNLTATLTREGQSIPAVLAAMEELSVGLRRLSGRVDTLTTSVDSSDAELTVTRADLSALQGSVSSLQTLTASLNTKMAAFSGMFRKVDEQLQEMWAEMDTVNNNVHHVMHEALEYQQQNERLFGELETMRSQLLAAFPNQLVPYGGSLPRALRSRRHQRRLSEKLCEIDDPVDDRPASQLTDSESADASTDIMAASGEESRQ